jgi:hypothetical protein
VKVNKYDQKRQRNGAETFKEIIYRPWFFFFVIYRQPTLAANISYCSGNAIENDRSCKNHLQAVPKSPEELILAHSLQTSETKVIMKLCRDSNRFQLGHCRTGSLCEASCALLNLEKSAETKINHDNRTEFTNICQLAVTYLFIFL